MCLLAQINPVSPRDSDDNRAAQLHHAHQVCGIVAHTKDNGIASVAIRSLAISAAVLRDRREQEEAVVILERIKRETGWRLGKVYGELGREWGWVPDPALTPAASAAVVAGNASGGSSAAPSASPASAAPANPASSPGHTGSPRSQNAGTPAVLQPPRLQQPRPQPPARRPSGPVGSAMQAGMPNRGSSPLPQHQAQATSTFSGGSRQFFSSNPSPQMQHQQHLQAQQYQQQQQAQQAQQQQQQQHAQQQAQQQQQQQQSQQQQQQRTPQQLTPPLPVSSRPHVNPLLIRADFSLPDHPYQNWYQPPNATSQFSSNGFWTG